MAENIVVTGGAGALGAAVVREMVARGSNVLAIDVPASRAGLASLEHEFPGSVLGVAMDVLDASAWQGALDAATKKFGDVRGAALIAGGWSGGRPLHEEQDESTLRAMLSRNVETAHASLRALLPGMVARAGGSIVVVGSRAAERPWTSANAAAYGASKAAVVALAQACAAEVLASNVRVNAVLPSTLDTPANRAAMPGVDPAHWVSLGSLARVIAFLLSDDARDVSGAAIPVYGRA